MRSSARAWGEVGTPLAVVVARPGGSVKTELDVLGNTRLDVVSWEAKALGVRTGQTVAAARAKYAELRVRVVPQEAVHAALVRVAESALALGPAVAFDVAEDVVWVDVGGCGHLHGGESGLAQALDARVRALGHACRVAIAGGPRIASAVARFAPAGKAREKGPFIVPEGKGAAAMRALPVAALGLDADVQGWLVDLGLRTCGDLQKLPRGALGTRLGARAYDVMQLLDGDDRAPLDAWRPPEVPEERVELEWGAGSVESLAFVMKTLCDRLAARLEGRAMAAGRIEIVLGLDRALVAEGVSPTTTLDIALPGPIARAPDLLAIVRARLERHTLAAPVLAAMLRTPELVHAPARALDLLSPEPKADRALPRLVSELAADFGGANVGTLALVDTWVPDARTRLVPFGVSRPPPPRRPVSAVSSAMEPSRLVRPVRVARSALVDPVFLARVETIEWWRRGIERRDLVAAWFSDALAWFQIDGATKLRGWID